MTKKTKKKQYFGKEIHYKIIEFQEAQTDKQKEKIYTDYIHCALSDLVDSLIVVYNFKACNEEIEHLKNDCISFLYETLGKWDHKKGTKAFSYFNVVAKNWLTINSRRLLKIHKRSAYIDDQDEGLTNEEKNEIANMSYEDDEREKLEEHKLFVENLIKMFDHIEENIKDQRDIKCMYAIRKVFDNIDNLEFLNKRAIFVYLREISGLNGNELSLSLSNMRKIYRRRQAYLQEFENE